MPQIDLEIHGILGLRLMNPTSSNVDLVKKQSGGIETTLERTPDIIINFVESIPSAEMSYIGLKFAGYRENDFFILEENRFGGKTKLPFHEIGAVFHMTIEQKIHSIPLFNHILNFCFLKKGYIPLHASAFEYENQGIVVAGWTKGGKTEALLAFANHGANYIGDEWVLLSAHDQKIYGLPIPICIWEWQLPEMHQNRPPIGLLTRLSFKSIHLISWFCESLSATRSGKSNRMRRLNKLVPLLRKQLHVRYYPSRLYANQVKTSANFQKLFLMNSHRSDEIRVHTLEKEDLIPRLVASNVEEMEPFFQFYQAFKYAFPEKANPLIDNLESVLTTQLEIALNETQLFKVAHPYPVSFENLFNEMRPYCSQGVAGTVLNHVN